MSQMSLFSLSLSELPQQHFVSVEPGSPDQPLYIIPKLPTLDQSILKAVFSVLHSKHNGRTLHLQTDAKVLNVKLKFRNVL